MMDVGLPVVLATDYNPGSSPSGRMAFVVSLACIKMKMLPEEAVVAATINGAFAMELGHETGSIATGKKANFFITRDCRNLAKLAYSFGIDPVGTVILNGRVYQQ
jgi:imidazolonepropionase